MEKSRVIYLAERYLAQTVTRQELEEFYALVRRGDGDTEINEALADYWLHYDTQDELPANHADAMFDGILRQANGLYPQPAKVVRMKGWRRAAAAAIIIAFAGSAYWYTRSVSLPPALSETQRFKNDVQPGGDKAVLRLSNGKEIILNAVADGSLAAEKGVHIEKQEGTVVYVAQDGGAGTGFNDISTPATGQYRVVLADGSKVWLDASSNIHFPAAFPGAAREVEVTGQAYFEVASNPGKPFRVRVRNQVVEVLGTHFNINAYDNEEVIRTTLAEGAVRVTVNGRSLRLKPGDQARVNPQGNLELIKDPDIEGTLAWKDGLFSYNGADIETIMRQVARWYGVNVVYKDKIAEQFVVEIPRTVTVSKLLSLMEATRQVHFTIEGKTITVTK
jgi:transmembrane sensor